MATSPYNSASALLFDRHAGFRHNTRSVLLNIGFGEVEAIQDAEELVARTSEGDFDVVIADISSSDDKVNKFVRQLRHNVIGKNPFVTVIITLFDSAQNHVLAAINSGADDLLMRPLSAKNLQERMASLVTRRKPFIVTSDYIGPERRAGPRPDGTALPMVVPNSLRAKVENNPEFEATPEAIKLAMNAVNDRKISSNSERLRSLAASLGLVDSAADDGAAVSDLLIQMKNASADLAKRVEIGNSGPVLELCTALENAIHVIQLRNSAPTQKDQLLLMQICQAIHKACQDAHDSAGHFFDIQHLATRIKEKG